MTAKQIFDLRKSGDLDGALEAFLGDIPSGYPDVKISQSEDRWLAIAALNVLVDLIRREKNAQTPDPEKLTRYRSLLSGLDLSCDEQNSRRQAAAMQDGQGSSVNRTSFLTPVSAADFQPPETSSPNAGGFDFPQDQTSFSSEGQFQQQSRASSADYPDDYVPYPSDPYQSNASEQYQSYQQDQYLPYPPYPPDQYQSHSQNSFQPYLQNPYSAPGQGYAVNMNDPEQILQELRNIPFQTNNQYAIDLILRYRELTGDKNQDNSLAWRCYFRIRELLLQNTNDIKYVKKLLNMYFKLQIKSSDRPKLHRCMLLMAQKIARTLDNSRFQSPYNASFSFASYFKVWDPEAMTEDYWQTEQPGRFKPLAASAISMAAKEISHNAKAPQELLEFYLPYVRMLKERDPGDIWCDLYLSRMLIRLGRADEAKEMLLPVIRSKSDSSWAWSELAQICMKESSELAGSCYARALLCSDPEAYKINIHKSFGEFLKDKGDLPHAKAEYMIYFANKSHPSADILAVQQEEWFISAQIPENQEDFYRSAAEQSEELIYDGMEKRFALLGPEVSYVDKNIGKEVKKRFLYVCHPFTGDLGEPELSGDADVMSKEETESLRQAMLLEIKVSASRVEKFVQQGNVEVLRLGGDIDENGSFSVKLIGLPSEKDSPALEMFGGTAVALADRIMKEGSIHAYINRGCEMKIFRDILGSDVPDVPFGLRFVPAYYYDWEDRPRFTVARFIEFLPLDRLPAYLVHRYSGKLRVAEAGFGFVDNTFVSPSLIEAKNLVSGSDVEGYACISYERKKEKWSYSAGTAEICGKSADRHISDDLENDESAGE